MCIYLFIPGIPVYTCEYLCIPVYTCVYLVMCIYLVMIYTGNVLVEYISGNNILQFVESLFVDMYVTKNDGNHDEFDTSSVISNI